MFTHKDMLGISELRNTFNFAILASRASGKYTDLSFISPMMHLMWHVGHEYVDLCNDPENIDKIKYRADIKLFIPTLQNTQKVKNIKINPHVSVLIANVDPVNNSCNLHLNIRGDALIYEGEEKENVWNKFFKFESPEVKNYFKQLKDDKDAYMIMIDTVSCMLYKDGNTHFQRMPEIGS